MRMRINLIPTTVSSNNAIQIEVIFVDDSTILSLHQNTKEQNAKVFSLHGNLCVNPIH